jgi:hypothetical protein
MFKNSSFAVDSQETNESLNRIKAKDTNNSLLNFEQTLANQLNNLSEKFSIKSNFNSETNLEKADFNTCSLNRKMSFKGPKLNEMKRKNTLFNNPVVQMLKSLTVIMIALNYFFLLTFINLFNKNKKKE